MRLSRTEAPEVQDLEKKERTRADVGAPGSRLKKMYVFSSFQADCYTVPIPDIPEAAWLASGSEWLILEQQ